MEGERQDHDGASRLRSPRASNPARPAAPDRQHRHRPVLPIVFCAHACARSTPANY